MQRLKAYRTLLDISQQEMADIIGISIHSYHNKENKKSEFTHSELQKIHEFFKSKIPGVTIEEIFFTNEVSKMITKEVE